MLSCDQVITELANYLDDDVAAELRREIEAHVARCRTCEAIYDSARKTLRIATESGTFELPEALSERIVASIMARIKPRSEPPASG